MKKNIISQEIVKAQENNFDKMPSNSKFIHMDDNSIFFGDLNFVAHHELIPSGKNQRNVVNAGLLIKRTNKVFISGFSDGITTTHNESNIRNEEARLQAHIKNS